MTHAPLWYPYTTPLLRGSNSLGTLILICYLYEYYCILLKRKRKEYPPSAKHFLHVRELRLCFIGEVLLALPHAPPLGFPMPLPLRGECRMSGYLPEGSVLWLSDHCYTVFSAYLAVLHASTISCVSFAV